MNTNAAAVNQLISMRINQELDTRYTVLAKKTGRSKSFYMKQALQDHIEDLEDLYIAVRRLEEPTNIYYTLGETEKMVDDLDN